MCTADINTSKSFSELITFLRFPLICLVVCIHSSVAEEYSYPDSSAVLENFVCSSLTSGAVPAFFFISGFLFFRNGLTLESYKTKLKSRFHSLLIPYILWTLIAFAILSIKYLPVFEHYFRNLHIIPYDIRLFLMSFVDRPLPQGVVSGHTPLLYPLWYVRDLMVLVILSPVIYSLRKYAIWFVVILSVICAFVWIERSEYQFYSLLFFIMGAYFKNTPPSQLKDGRS